MVGKMRRGAADLRKRRGGAGQLAAERIGRLDRAGRPGARESMDHAQWVWGAATRSVVARADALDRSTRGLTVEALLGQVDLVLVSVLGDHLGACERCWVRWTDGYRPADLITGAVRRRPAGAILRAAETEMKARRGKGTGQRWT